MGSLDTQLYGCAHTFEAGTMYVRDLTLMHVCGPLHGLSLNSLVSLSPLPALAQPVPQQVQ